MNLTPFNGEVLFATEDVRELGPSDLEMLRNGALISPAGRLRICLHQEPEATLHEMLIALRDDVYYPPHKHSLTEESYWVAEGLARLHVYDANGQETRVIDLGDPQSGRSVFARIPPDTFHCLMIQSRVCIYLETKLGPFSVQPNVTASFPGPGAAHA